LPKGGAEVEQWLTWRRQKAHGNFNEWEGRSELSYGVTDAFQLSGYLNYAWTQAFHNGVDGATAPPEQFAVYNQVDRDARFNASKFTGVSVEALYRVLSPTRIPSASLSISSRRSAMISANSKRAPFSRRISSMIG